MLKCILALMFIVLLVQLANLAYALVAVDPAEQRLNQALHVAIQVLVFASPVFTGTLMYLLYGFSKKTQTVSSFRHSADFPDVVYFFRLLSAIWATLFLFSLIFALDLFAVFGSFLLTNTLSSGLVSVALSSPKVKHESFLERLDLEALNYEAPPSLLLASNRKGGSFRRYRSPVAIARRHSYYSTESAIQNADFHQLQHWMDELRRFTTTDTTPISASTQTLCQLYNEMAARCYAYTLQMSGHRWDMNLVASYHAERRQSTASANRLEVMGFVGGQRNAHSYVDLRRVEGDSPPPYSAPSLRSLCVPSAPPIEDFV